MKKILVVANVAKEHINKFHLPIIKKLKDLGWRVDVACQYDAVVPYCDRQYEMVYQRNPISFMTIKGVKQLREILKSVEYDVLNCQTATGATVARLACIGLKNKPRIVYIAHGFHFYKGSSIKTWLLFFPVEKLLSRITDCIVTINYEDYETAKKRLSAKSVEYINGIGVDLKRFYRDNYDYTNLRAEMRQKLEFKPEDQILTYVAELNINKNQESLLYMLRELLKHNPNARLMLVGPDHYNGYLQEKAKQLGISERVTFTGWRSDVPQLLFAADIAVASSICEGLGLNVIEAMASGIPVVAYDNRGHRDIIKNGVNGYLIKHNDYLNMSEVLSYLLEHDEVREMIAQNAIETVGKYEQSSIVEKIVKIYDSYVLQEIESEEKYCG